MFLYSVFLLNSNTIQASLMAPRSELIMINSDENIDFLLLSLFISFFTFYDFKENDKPWFNYVEGND